MSRLPMPKGRGLNGASGLSLPKGSGPSVQSAMTPTTRRGSQVVDVRKREEERREEH